MALNSVRRMAADLLKCGKSRVKILNEGEAAKALTRDDVRLLVNQGFIVETLAKTNSRANAILKQSKKRAGRRRGKGSLKGAKYAGVTRKDLWMRKVRAQRAYLKFLKMKLGSGAYKGLYAMIKGGNFKSRKVLEAYVRDNNLFKAK